VAGEIRLRNPLLEAFDKYVELRRDYGWPEWQERTDWRPGNGFVGPAWECSRTASANAWMAKRYLRPLCSFAVPNDEAIFAIAELKMPVVEIGAGTGYWAWMLRQAGVEVEAFDKVPDPDMNEWMDGDSWTEVKRGTSIVLKDFAQHALMLCWPPYEDPMALDCLHEYQGDTIIFIGEWSGGCCATDAFFKELETWMTERDVDIPKWPGMHDFLRILRRGPS
jgi:hypothetical protein